MIRRFFLREANMLAAIILNSIVIFALYFPQLEDTRWLINVDHLFIALFTIEAIIKIRTYGWKGYWSSYWNRFDFTIVIGSAAQFTTVNTQCPTEIVGVSSFDSSQVCY